MKAKENSVSNIIFGEKTKLFTEKINQLIIKFSSGEQIYHEIILNAQHGTYAYRFKLPHHSKER